MTAKSELLYEYQNKLLMLICRSYRSSPFASRDGYAS